VPVTDKDRGSALAAARLMSIAAVGSYGTCNIVVIGMMVFWSDRQSALY
jgi:hypothetical protein